MAKVGLQRRKLHGAQDAARRAHVPPRLPAGEVRVVETVALCTVLRDFVSPLRKQSQLSEARLTTPVAVADADAVPVVKLLAIHVRESERTHEALRCIGRHRSQHVDLVGLDAAAAKEPLRLEAGVLALDAVRAGDVDTAGLRRLSSIYEQLRIC